MATSVPVMEREAPMTTPPGATAEGPLFAALPDYVLDADITATAVRVFCLLHVLQQRDERPSVDQIGAMLNVEGRTVQRALRDLQRIGSIKVSAKRSPQNPTGANEYVLNMRAPGGGQR